jgi:8-amino-7-oxononanoate synthase
MAVRDGVAQHLALRSTLAGKLPRAPARLFAEPPCRKEHLIIHVGMFSVTATIPPYRLEQIGTSLRLAQRMNRERNARFANVLRLSSGLRPRGWDTPRSAAQIVPLITGENHQAAYARTQGFAVWAVHPPTVSPGSARPRFSLTSGISDDELVRLESPLNTWREQESWSAAVAYA